MISVTCPTCGSSFNTSDGNAGRNAKCPNCQNPLTIPGATAPAPAPAQAPAAQAPVGVPADNSGVSIAGFVCGLVALILSFIPCINWFAFFPAIAGLICSIIGLVTAKKAGKKKGLAIAGLILSAIAIIWIPVFILLIMASVAGSAGLLL